MSFDTQVGKFSYAIGLSLGSNLLQSQIKTVEYKALFKAIEDVLEGRKPDIPPHEANRVIEEYFTNQQARIGAENQKIGQAFLAENEQKEGVIKLESGLQYEVLSSGNGHKPSLTNKVKCHYHGTLINGEVFDSSVERGQPAVFPVNGVIKGWIEALQLMGVGAKWRLFIPPHLAYGEHGSGSVIGPQSTLIFDVELLEII
ncbi:MAG: FKBP-type peptidyl-prolyl cis-trans isomerase [Prolixibacteraceae bacterium]|nr:FKBP-type peptidyl-prolyl cis-trans isomerase [Prolixibacteraceae bacterium]